MPPGEPQDGHNAGAHLQQRGQGGTSPSQEGQRQNQKHVTDSVRSFTARLTRRASLDKDAAAAAGHTIKPSKLQQQHSSRHSKPG